MRNGRRLVRSSLAALAGSGILVSAAAPALLAAAPAYAQVATFLIPVDQARIIDLPRPAGTVIIGNPAIAEATVVNQSRLVITGRSFGSTNLIILDEDGELISEQMLTVQTAEFQVTVYRGETRTTYSCAPVCEPTLNVGDSEASFATTSSQIQTRSSMAE